MSDAKTEIAEPPTQYKLRPALSSPWSSARPLEFMINHIDLCKFESGLERGQNEAEDEPDSDDSDYEEAEDDGAPASTFQEARALYRLYGTTAEGHSVFCAVRGFTPYFYVEVPEDTRWTGFMANQLAEAVRAKFRDQNKRNLAQGVASAQLVERESFYGFTNGEARQYVRLCFTSMFSFYAARSLLQETALAIPFVCGERRFHLVEHKVTQVQQFLLDLDISPSGWVRLEAGRYGVSPPGSAISYCQIDVRCVYKALTVLERNEVAPILIASFDIECMRENQDPELKIMPNALKPGDAVIQIGLTLHRWGDKGAAYQCVFTLGSCDALEGIEIRSFHSERALLKAWRTYWCEEIDADVITGWNIGFDLNYLHDRATEICGLYSFDELGKVRGERSQARKARKSFRGEEARITVGGRVQVDMLSVVQKDVTIKLKDYRLGAVSQHFLNDDKEDLDYFLLWKYQLMTSWHRAQIAFYCAKDTLLPLRLMLKLCTIPNLVEYARVTRVPMLDIVMRGQQIKTYNLTVREAHSHGILLTNPPRGTLLAPLRASDVLVSGGWNYYAKREQVDPSAYEYVEVPLSKAARSKLKAFDSAPTVGKRRKRDTIKGYEGAIVVSPIRGYYKEPIPTLDYASLYPSIMISFHLCYRTIVLQERYLGLPGVSYRRLPLKQKNRDAYPLWWVENRPTLLPKILSDLLAARKRAKKDMATAFGSGDNFLGEVLNGRQLALKIVANSVYGFTGADQKGMLPCMPVAAATTYYGRWMIEQTKRIVEENYPPAQVVYGDSVTGDTPVLCKDEHGRARYTRIDALFSENESQVLLEKDVCFPRKLCTWSDLGWTRVRAVVRHRARNTIYRVRTTRGHVDVTEEHSLLDTEGKLLHATDLTRNSQLLFRAPPAAFGTRAVKHSYQRGWKAGARAQATPDSQVFPEEILDWDAASAQLFLDGLVRYQLKHGRVPALTQDSVQSAIFCALLDRCEQTHLAFESSHLGARLIDLRALDEDEDEDNRPYVYDLETECHHFAAGVGQLVVHNTDSVMVNFKRGDDHATFLSLFEIGEEAAQLCTEFFAKHTITHAVLLEFEKIYWPYILYRKKGYAAIKYETPDKGSKDVKGLAEVRRDFCDLVSETSDAVGNALLWDKDVDKAQGILLQVLDDLENGRVPLEKLILSKTLSKKGYANTHQVQAVVAAKVVQRDPARAYRGGDRVHYLVIDIGDPNDKRGLDEKAEDPAYVREHNLKIDYLWYVQHQLKNPLVNVLGPVLKDPTVLFADTIRRLHNRQSGMRDISSFFTRGNK